MESATDLRVALVVLLMLAARGNKVALVTTVLSTKRSNRCNTLGMVVIVPLFAGPVLVCLGDQDELKCVAFMASRPRCTLTGEAGDQTTLLKAKLWRSVDSDRVSDDFKLYSAPCPQDVRVYI